MKVYYYACVKNNYYFVYTQRHVFNISEFIENIEYMFPGYHVHRGPSFHIILMTTYMISAVHP